LFYLSSKTFSVELPFFEKHSVKWPMLFCLLIFRSNDHFRKKLAVKWTFGQMTFRSKDLSVKLPFGHFSHLTGFSNLIFGQITIFQIFSVKRPFDKFSFRSNDFFGKIYFRSNGMQSNGVRLNGISVKWCSVKRCSVKWCFGQKAFGQKFRWNDFSEKWSRTVS
jgi:hypothetical protein